MINYLVNIFNYIKTSALALLASAVAIFGFLYIYEKNKVDVDESLLKEEKLNETLAKDNNKIEQNNQQLIQEEKNRQAIEKGPDEVSPPTTNNILDFFNRKR